MLRISGEVSLQVVFVVSCIFRSQGVQGGTCWQDGDRTDATHGRCRNMMETGVSRADCCGNRRSRGWSSDDITPAQIKNGRLFYINYLSGGGVDCEICPRTCANFRCQDDRKCRLSSLGEPKCVCDPDCSNSEWHHKGPVCGYDGREYKNYCHLRRRNCVDRQFMEVDYAGKCQRTCETVTCPAGKSCGVDQNGTPHCAPCLPLSYCQSLPQTTVCGSDGVTYNNSCYLARQACLQSRNIFLAYDGECRDGASCNEVQCGRDYKCLVRPGGLEQPHCVQCTGYCSERLLLEGPICSTHGHTYPDWCRLREAACREGVALDVKHKGPCRNDDGHFELPTAAVFEDSEKMAD